MIYAYGVRVNGPYHIKNNIPCQDAFEILKCSDDLVIAAVADGLGSAEYSDVASELAVKISLKHCGRDIPKVSTDDEILAIMKKSFVYVQNFIEKVAKRKKHDVAKYDTTLSLAVLKKDTLYFGHSGDSGIVALTMDGSYQKVTEQQRDDNNCVFPLIFRDEWVFEKFDKKVASVLLATDGIYETLFPFLIRNEDVKIHIRLAHYLMDNSRLKINERGESAVTDEIKKFIENIPPEQVDDDKTVVVLANTAVKPELQSDDYYQEPDWATLRKKHDEEWKRLAYPHLFKDEEGNQGAGKSDTENASRDNLYTESENQISPMTSGQSNSNDGGVVKKAKSSIDKKDKAEKKNGFWGFSKKKK